MSSPVMFKARCPNCGSTVRLEQKPELESLVFCPECDETLEVVSVNPLRLDWAYDDDDDYDDEGDTFYDDDDDGDDDDDYDDLPPRHHDDW